jgi:hypothetical protein
MTEESYICQIKILFNMDSKVKANIQSFPDSLQSLALEMREIILSVDPEIKDVIKWNQLTFVKGKTNIAFIYTYPDKDYLNLAFFKAIFLSDPEKKFKGTGKQMRHVKIKKQEDISIEEIQNWVAEALALEESAAL